MSLTLDATYGGSSANSYIGTLDEADTIANLLSYLPQIEFDSSSWDDATDAAKIMALVMSAQGIDRQLFVGHRLNAYQRREWPRVETGYAYWNHTTESVGPPDEVKWAQVAEAAKLLSPDTAKTAAQAGIVSESIDGHSVTYDKSARMKASDNLGDVALGILKRAGLIPTGARGVYISRG